MSTFEELGLQGWLTKQCSYMALDSPTPIQKLCIPAILRGEHVVGGAATGSGKTAAFALPILQDLSADVYGVFALVLTPSRELAYQIVDQFIAFGAPLRLRTMLAIGGVRYEDQVEAIKSRPSVVVATPGRLLHLLETFAQETRRAFAHLRYLVLDEADRLTEGDVSATVRELLGILPPTPKRQVLLFSATLEPRLTGAEEASVGDEDSDAAPWLVALGVHAAARPTTTTADSDNRTATQPRPFAVCDLGTTATRSGDDGGAATEATASPSPKVAFPDTLTQSYVFIPDMVKLPNLVAALRAQGKSQSTIVFTNSCMRAELVRLTLQLLGFPVCSLDSLLTQQHRLDNLAMFKLGIARILVATDIAARGLDIPVVGTIIHYDFPKHAATYVHRVGRTARAGKEGQAIALVTEHDVALVQRVERRLGIRLELWREKALREGRILKILDEVSAAKVQARQQVTEQFGNRAATLKTHAAEKRAEAAAATEASRKTHSKKASPRQSGDRAVVKRSRSDDAPQKSPRRKKQSS